MTDRAPRPEGMSDDLEALTAAMKADCNEHVNGQCHTLACYKRGGYQGFGPATAFTPTCQAKQVLSLIDECSRLRADGATLRERVKPALQVLKANRPPDGQAMFSGVREAIDTLDAIFASATKEPV